MVNSDRFLTRACFSLDADNKANLPSGYYSALSVGIDSFELRRVSHGNEIVPNTLSNKQLIELIYSPALLEKR